jgi:PAS domain S-box-containing protein
MRNGLRKSGIEIIGDVPWGTHICQFYQTKEELTETLLPYFKAGLENHEFCLWITSQPLEVDDAIEALREIVPSLSFHLKKGQIEIISYNDWFFTDGIFNLGKVLNGCTKKLTYALHNGYDGVRFSRNNSWLDKKNLDIFAKYKEQTENIIYDNRMLVLSTYCLNKRNIDELIYLSVNHHFTLVKSDGKWNHIESSKRKMAEETAVKITKDWEYTFDAVPDLIAIIDTNYKIVRANSAMASKLGMTTEECIGLTCYHVVHGTANPPSFCPHKHLLKDKLEHTAEVCEDCLGGYFIVSVSPVYDTSGKLTGSIHVARDINERKRMEEALRESEEKYRNLIETANEGIWILDAEFMTTYVNVKMAEMIGYSRKSMVGKSIHDFTDEEGKAINRLNIENGRQGTNENHEFKLIRENGSPLWAYVNSKSFFNNNDEFVGSMHMLTDVTQRKEAETKLKETLDNMENLVRERTVELERAYNSLKENEKGLAEAQRIAHIGNLDWNLVTDEVYWSDELYRIFKRNPLEKGATYDEFLGYIHPEDRDRIHNAVRRALKKETVAGDYSIVLANGEERKVYTHIEIIFNDNNIPVRIKGTVEDITERKETEEKIRNLANIVESSNDAIGTISLKGTLTSWNKGAEEVYGYSAEEIIGKHVSVAAPSHLVDETEKLCERVKQGENINNYETLRLRKDGKIIDVSITLSPVYDLHGKMTAFSFVSRNITERKRAEEKLRESEEKYRIIVETANEGVVKTDAEDIINYVNKKMVDMLGYTLEECIGRPVWDFFSEEYRPLIKQNREKKKQGASESGELKLIQKNGSHLWTHVNLKPLFDKEGKYMGVVSMLTDITKRKEAEEALANIEIARKKEIHHRIKNNLQVISSLLDLQADKFNNRECIKYSEVLEAFKESQDRVISMALIHEELYKGEGLEKLNFSPYIEELSENLFRTYKFGNINISLSLSLEENICFDMDVAIPLGMIINELVSNSFKHAFRGRKDGEIQIKLHREENGGYIKRINKICKSTTFSLTVSDNGIGIPEKLDIQKLDSLGLQLVTSLIAQIDGELEIKRSNGVEFTIRFAVIENENHISVKTQKQLVD